MSRFPVKIGQVFGRLEPGPSQIEKGRRGERRRLPRWSDDCVFSPETAPACVHHGPVRFRSALPRQQRRPLDRPTFRGRLGGWVPVERAHATHSLLSLVCACARRLSSTVRSAPSAFFSLARDLSRDEGGGYFPGNEWRSRWYELAAPW